MPLSPAIVDCESRIMLSAQPWFAAARVDGVDTAVQGFVVASDGSHIGINVNGYSSPERVSDSITVGSTEFKGRTVLTVNGAVVCSNAEMSSVDWLDPVKREEILSANAISVSSIRSIDVNSPRISLAGVDPNLFASLQGTILRRPADSSDFPDPGFHVVGSFVHDSITYRASGGVGTAGAAAVFIESGGGEDEIVVDLRRDTSFTINSGAGKDKVQLLDFFDINAFSIGGASGGIAVSSDSGKVSLTLSGASSDDVTIYLGSGADQMSFTDLAGTPASMNLRIDAGPGADWVDASAAGTHPLVIYAGTDTDMDIIVGGNGGDILLGSRSDGSGDGDTLIGFGGNDELSGSDAADYLFGGEGNDILSGGLGDDYLSGDEGNDDLDGGQGADQQYGGADDDTFWGNAGNDFSYGQEGRDMFRWDPLYADFDEIDGGDDADLFVNELWTSGLNFVLDDDAGSEHLLFSTDTGTAAQLAEVDAILFVGSDSNDTFTIKSFYDNGELPQFPAPIIGMIGRGGGDVFKLENADFVAGLYVLGGSDRDHIFGGATSEVLIGGTGDDEIDGGAGDDLILGEDGADEIVGGIGNDWIIGGAGNDTVHGGADDDWIADSLPGVVDEIRERVGKEALLAVEQDLRGEFDKVIAAESHQGGTNHFFGEAGSDVLIGGTGEDTLDGGDNDDVILGEGFELSASVSFTTYFTDLTDFRLSADLGINPTSGMKDTILGGKGFELILGGNGDDDIDAGEGSAIIFGDSVRIAVGDVKLTNSEASFHLLPQIELAGTGDDKITAGHGDDPLFNLVLGGSGDDTIYGGDATLDILFGNSGDDTIVAGLYDNPDDPGADVVVGGDGGDELKGGNFANLIIGDSFALNGFSNLSWESLKKGRFDLGVALKPEDTGDDKLFGGDGFDFLVGGHGGDTIRGNGGLNIAFGDTFSFSVGAGIDVSELVDSTSERSSIRSDPTSFFNLLHTKFTFAGDGIDKYFGGDSVDVAFGGGGKDELRGEGGWDFLVGGEGNDTVDGGPGFVISLGGGVLFGGPGDDVLTGGEQDDWLESEEGNDTFYGNGGNDVIRGGAGDDELYGGDGNDELFGEEGADLLDGGEGDDIMTGGPDPDRFLGGPGTNTIVDPEGGVRVQQVIVNSGAIQRSNIETLQIQLSEGLDLQPLIDSGAIVDLVTVNALLRQPGRVSLAKSAYRWNSLTRTLTIDLTTDGFGGRKTTRLADDIYNVSIDAAIDPRFEDGDGQSDGAHRFEFHRLAGDYNGDRKVTLADGAGWQDPAVVRFGAKLGSAGYDVAYDLDGDGVISSRDYYYWQRSLLGKSLS